ncbi:shikimate 5-dehydrogenase [Acidocella aminolytica 101 = DSM 11237]|uniref:Shikimate dehydrogenase (NADP(+)) n=2 Tax=Acidocella TaxID=50709 RepID=A0A0D6PFD7_9PROT|nr:shikimate dehydrogenase [Acidocella aminolytica]GAN79918.1 shikimate 5-dehydrogenase [Acidocella aminolytica 101 = DSM 11237]GBQ36897.1 shikimate 5-dehydrogenase [Acidocella aminolytica 101 = DSM 11237]
MRLISGSARLAGVTGWPVAHSRSPRIHNTWLARHGIDGAYVPLPIRPDDFPSVIPALAKAGFAGVNVTIPHKEAAFAICVKVDDFARRAGAVNTLIFTPHGIEGSNTDGYGFVANLRHHGVKPAAGPVLILGAGGAARGIGAALQDEGAEITITNRTPERAAALAAALPPAKVLPWEQREDALGDYALLINTTSLGMVHEPPLPMNLDRAAPGLAVADIIFAPLETQLLADAKARGLKPVEGLGMLLHQAVPGFSAWFGVTPEVDEALYRIVAA